MIDSPCGIFDLELEHSNKLDEESWEENKNPLSMGGKHASNLYQK